MRFALRILRWFVALAIFAGILEVCARVDDALSFGAPFWAPYNNDILFSEGPIGRWGVPGAQYQKWQMNNLGFRGPEVRAETTRVVCLGSSETFGLYEPAGQEYPRQLERLLDSKEKNNIQVVNAAVVGDTLAAAWHRLPYIANKVQPSFAVIYPSPASYIWLPWVRDEPRANAGIAAPSPARNAHLEFRVEDRVRTLLKQTIPPNIQTWLRRRETEREVARNRYAVMSQVPEENIIRFRTHLERLVASLRERGVEPVLVTHATYFGLNSSEADREMLIAWRKFYPMLSEEGFINLEQRVNDSIRSVAAQQHIVLVDAARQIPPGSEYFADFSHFTALGAAFIAERIAEKLNPLIDTHLQKRASSTLPTDISAGPSK